MPRKPKSAAYRCTSSFAVYGKNGVPRVYRQGAIVGGDDPILKTHAHAFTDAVPEGRVEQATQAPGERRNIVPPPPDSIDDDEPEDEHDG